VTRASWSCLRLLYQRWPFFRMLISKVEMTLSKVDLDLAHHYVEALGRPGTSRCLRADVRGDRRRVTLTRDLVLQISGHGRLLDGDPALQLSVDLRNRTIIPWAFFKLPCCADSGTRTASHR